MRKCDMKLSIFELYLVTFFHFLVDNDVKLSIFDNVSVILVELYSIYNNFQASYDNFDEYFSVFSVTFCAVSPLKRRITAQYQGKIAKLR